MQSVKEIAATYKSVLKRFVCVYQVQFDGFLAPGIGDYIRGCICMLQLLEIMNKHCGTSVEFEMDMRNHPMSRWLSLPAGYNVRADVPYGRLTNFHVNTLEVRRDENDVAYRHVLKEIVDKVRDFCRGEEEHYDFMCRPEIFADVSEAHKAFIRSRLVPSPAMETYIQAKMDGLGIISGEYSVIHVRTRDEMTFPPTALPGAFLASLYDAVKTNIDPGRRYFLITSHKGVKDFFIRFTNVCMLVATKMCHLGQELAPSEEAMRDTVLDFFLLSRAREIIGFSPYGISGFSSECAKIFNVPFKKVAL